jgi:hypothetical protein
VPRYKREHERRPNTIRDLDTVNAASTTSFKAGESSRVRGTVARLVFSSINRKSSAASRSNAAASCRSMADAHCFSIAKISARTASRSPSRFGTRSHPTVRKTAAISVFAVIETALIKPAWIRRQQKKQGRGLSRVPVWQDCFSTVLLQWADFGVVAEMQIVVALTMELDPTLNDGVYRKPRVHRDPQRFESVRMYRYAGRHANPIVTRT